MTTSEQSSDVFYTDPATGERYLRVTVTDGVRTVNWPRVIGALIGIGFALALLRKKHKRKKRLLRRMQRRRY